MDIRNDWPRKHDGDYMDANQYWRNKSGELIGLPSPALIEIKDCTFSSNDTYGIYIGATLATDH